MNLIAFGYNLKLFSFSCFVFLCFDLASQTFTDSKKEVQSFKADKNTSVEIDNKYGKVHVIPWQKDSVRIEAELFVGSNNLSKMEKTKNNIRFDFTSTSYYITARTNFGSSPGSQFFQDLKGLSGNILPGSGTVEINYTIYCPVDMNLSIINKFGNIYIDDHKGELKISLSNGDLKINHHEGNAQVELNFGSGIINQLSEARLTVSYSDIRIRNAGRLTLDSKSSTVNIDDCEVIRSTSRRDKYFITNTHSISANGFFTQYWVESVESEAEAQLKFGSFHINDIGQGFSKVNITSEFADLNLSIEKGAKYEADIFYHPDANLSLPAEIKGKESGFSVENPLLRHINYVSGASDARANLRIYAIQKCLIKIN